MEKARRVLDYYLVCCKLKDTIRTGWKKWGVKRERLESVAEHIYATQMLALAIYSEYHYDIDIMKVIFMLAIHELGETQIGNFTPFDITRAEKEKIEREAVRKVLAGLEMGDEFYEYFLEFDEKKTPEAIFAYQCDKLEAELTCRRYDLEKCVDLSDLPKNEVTGNSDVRNLLQKTGSWSEAFAVFDRKLVDFDKNFQEVSDCNINN